MSGQLLNHLLTVVFINGQEMLNMWEMFEVMWIKTNLYVRYEMFKITKNTFVSDKFDYYNKNIKGLFFVLKIKNV